jgi:hypothetical protein
MASYPIKRCAIYTRKSSEEGLEQHYNSLHAQREACEGVHQEPGGRFGSAFGSCAAISPDSALSESRCDRPRRSLGKVPSTC